VYELIGDSRKSLRWILRAYVKGPSRKLLNGIERIRYPGPWERQLCGDTASQMISAFLMGNDPFLVGRIGHTEGRIVGESTFCNNRFGRMTKKESHQYSGIFPVNKQLLTEFAGVYASAISQSDLLGFWQTSYQAKLLAKLYSQVALTPLAALEPYLHVAPWSSSLKGRRVLVVHPFASTIRSQFELNRTRIFADQNVLPEMALQVLAPPQTLAPLTGGFATWLDALNHLTHVVLQTDFDVALLGCGAYGLPLGAAIKAAGRQAIHLGGALQVLFGIRGRRWEQIPSIAGLMNEYWVRPSEQETPVSAKLVDEGCYW
jgi:hypothetical protein